MTTYEFVRGATVATTPRVRAVIRLLAGVARRARAYVLPLAGFGLLTGAAFEWNLIAGLVTAGASCFALDYGAGKARQ